MSVCVYDTSIIDLVYYIHDVMNKDLQCSHVSDVGVGMSETTRRKFLVLT